MTHLHITKHRLAPHSKYDTAYYVVRGNGAGNTVMVTAGVHGNESAGIRAANEIVDLLRGGAIRLRRGKLIVVPVVNAIARRRRIRGKPDLNRTFPKKRGDAARHPLSAALLAVAKRHKPGWYIDLHEANGLSKLNPRALGQTLLVNPRSPAVRPAGRVVSRINRSIAKRSLRFTVRQRPLPGSGRHAAYRLWNAKAITVETCWSMAKSTRVRFQTDIVRAFLQEARLV
ncbi:succinylglutamate desuccinylase/aspartoacylase family protein [Paenibacillus sp. GYB003]|uniref:succinylglutamate desuccinylase/aspartoacylase family protein n=1 Tax=Paenibacillus sp. GYB003 TaxID=2994392 RepID=UPI002F96E6A7